MKDKNHSDEQYHMIPTVKRKHQSYCKNGNRKKKIFIFIRIPEQRDIICRKTGYFRK
jgi:hypothetical protein